MNIRKASLKDINEIVKLDHQYEKYENNLDKSFKITPFNESKNQLIKRIKNKEVSFIIAEENNTPFAAISLSIDKRGKTKIGLIQNLFISKEYRGKGIGEKLVNLALEALKKEGCLYVKSFVTLKNKKAQSFWKKRGFSLEEIKGYKIMKRLK